MNLFERYLREQADVLFFLLNNDTSIVNYNVFVQKNINTELLANAVFFKDVVVSFNADKVIDSSFPQANKTYRLNIQAPNGLPVSYQFQFYFANTHIYAFGKPEHDNYAQVQRKTIQLTNELSNLSRQLAKNNKDLTKLNTFKDLMISIAAHDLRNPLGFILNMSQLVLDGNEKMELQKQVKFIKEINYQSRYMLDLLSDLLEYSKIELQPVTIEKKQVDLHSYANKKLKLYYFSANKKKIHIKTEIDILHEPVYIDEIKIDRVFDNIFSNALKYSESGSQVVFRLRDRANFFRIEVQDFGQGIASEYHDKLFTPFGKAGSKPTNGESSTGLGLSIAKSIVDAHGGQIGFVSELGKGSTFYFEIPKK